MVDTADLLMIFGMFSWDISLQSQSSRCGVVAQVFYHFTKEQYKEAGLLKLAFKVWNIHSIHQIYCQFGISIRRSWFVVGGVPHCGPDYRNGSLKWWQYWRFEVTFSMVPMLCKCHKYYFCHFLTISKPGINMQFLKVCSSSHYWVVSALEFIKPWVDSEDFNVDNHFVGDPPLKYIINQGLWIWGWRVEHQ